MNNSTAPPTTTFPSPGDSTYSALVLSTSVIALTANLYTLFLLVQQKKKRGFLSLVSSLACQILFWDFVRCVCLGMITGLIYVTSDTSMLCTILGPFTNMAQRLPFFLAMGQVLTGLEKAESSAALRRTGTTVVVLGYLISACYAILPFLSGNTYSPGYPAPFCTYYAADVLGYDLDYSSLESRRYDMMCDILLSMVPFLVLFTLLLVTFVPAICARKKEKFSLCGATALLVCHIPSLCVVLAFIAEYFGIFFFYHRLGAEAFTLLMVLAIVVFPVAIPVTTIFFSTVRAGCYRCSKQLDVEARRGSWHSSCNASTSILVDNIDGTIPE